MNNSTEEGFYGKSFHETIANMQNNPTPHTVEDWGKEFDENYPKLLHAGGGELCTFSVKDFIRKIRTQALREGQERAVTFITHHSVQDSGFEHLVYVGKGVLDAARNLST